MSMKTIPYLIIGAGISGLCAADALGEGALILEKEPEPGGYCRSIRQNGFVWDYAGHFFHFRSERARRFFLDLFMPEELAAVDKRSRILLHGSYIDAPFQTHLRQLDKPALIDCLYDLFRRESAESYGSFLEMLYGRFGRSITELFLRPYNEKLYACDLSRLDEKAMGRFFPCPSLAEIVESLKRDRNESYNGSFFYPKNGAGAFVDRLCARLPSGCLLTGRALTAVDLQTRTAEDSEGQQYRFERLINTGPLHRFLPLLRTEAADRLAAGLSCNKVLVFNLGFARACPERREHWIYVPDRGVNFYRIGFYNNLLGSEPASLYLEIGFPENAAVDEKAELERAMTALYDTEILSRGMQPLCSSALVMDPAYVHIGADTEREVSLALKELERSGVYSIGRYGSWTYCSMEDCMLQAWALAERLKRESGSKA